VQQAAEDRRSTDEPTPSATGIAPKTHFDPGAAFAHHSLTLLSGTVSGAAAIAVSPITCL
jgi:hypothetical protein